jgi:hypothetical protein
VLNDFTEQYELRRLTPESKIDWKNPQIEPTRIEWQKAAETLENLRKAGNAKRGGNHHR